ncbi:hypothetical protein MNBD_GAMMA23-755 [hydrothermal vent metagenome]|uniref:Uncharacterized protein n=1 Tax=hydrothermal vent metagenome TaxID=652676 RepID=A0A3B0ZK49_9ZZZZ
MKKILCLFTALLLLLLPALSSAAKRTTASIIAKEPVTMMDLGLLKLNSMLANTQFSGLHGATIGAIYNARRGTIDLKVSLPVKKASKALCKRAINNTKKIFIQTYGDNKVANIHHYFKHEGTAYKNKIKWKNLANDVVITAIVLTKKNYQHSVYCQSKLMRKKVTY